MLEMSFIGVYLVVDLIDSKEERKKNLISNQ